MVGRRTAIACGTVLIGVIAPRVHTVIVNGRVVWSGGRASGERPGRLVG